MFGFAVVFVEVGWAVLRVFCLLVRRGTLGWSAWVGVALLPIELVGTAFVGRTVFVLLHLALNLALNLAAGTVFGGVWLAGRTLFVARTSVGRTLLARPFVGRTAFERTMAERTANRSLRGYDGLASGRMAYCGQATSGHRQTRLGQGAVRRERVSRLGGRGRGSASPVEW